jgi:hypothetical protein
MPKEKKMAALTWRIKLNYEIIWKGSENKIWDFAIHNKADITKKHIWISMVEFLL